MLKLSTKGRYGARAMLELTLNYGDKPILLREVAKNQEISLGYLEHIFHLLKQAGLINSGRGAHGGYTLAKPPEKITLEEVIRALEGRMDIVECISTPGVCRRVKSCVTRDIWEEITGKIKNILDSVTLQDMLERQQKKNASQSLSYSI